MWFVVSKVFFKGRNIEFDKEFTCHRSLPYNECLFNFEKTEREEVPSNGLLVLYHGVSFNIPQHLN